MKSAKFDELLDHCLLRIAAGEPLEKILAEHPLEAEALRQLLPLADAYQAARPPLPSMAGRSRGKQAMLAAFDEAFPARPVSWWERLWNGSSRPLIYVGTALAAVAIMLVAVFALRPPNATVAEIVPTEVVAVALVTTEAAAEIVASDVAAIATEIAPTASPMPLPTELEASRNGDSTFAIAVEAESDAESIPAGTSPAPAAAVPPAGGNSMGASETPPFAGEWLISVLNDTTLAEPFVTIISPDGAINIITECGDLTGQYAATDNTISVWALMIGLADDCSAEAEQLIDELKLALGAVANWNGEPIETISLLEDEGNILLEMSRAIE